MNSQFNHRYPSNLTNRQWKHIQSHIPPAKPGGRPRILDMREVVNAILYVLVGGIQWRMMPLDFPRWPSVYYYFRLWCRQGVWKRLHDTLRALLRQHQGRHKHPTAACLDSQSVKGTHVPGARGYDAGKNVCGRKRHLLVDTLGLVLAVLITTADVSDAQGARWLLASLQGFCKKLRLIWVDGSYRGELMEWVAQQFVFKLVPVLRSDAAVGFQLLPRRWVVERTFAWLGLHRRLAREYEEYPLSSENFVYIAMIRLMTQKTTLNKSLNYFSNRFSRFSGNSKSHIEITVEQQHEECPLQKYTRGKNFIGEDVWADVAFFSSLDKINAIAGAAGIKISVVKGRATSFRVAGADVVGAIVPPAKRSNHLIGHAIDVNIKWKDANNVWHFANSSQMQTASTDTPVGNFIARMKNAKFRWGGDFSKKDPVHFDDGLNLINPKLWQEKFDIMQKCVPESGFPYPNG